jgi:hypothetical protein
VGVRGLAADPHSIAMCVHWCACGSGGGRRACTAASKSHYDVQTVKGHAAGRVGHKVASSVQLGDVLCEVLVLRGCGALQLQRWQQL